MTVGRGIVRLCRKVHRPRWMESREQHVAVAIRFLGNADVKTPARTWAVR